MSLDGVMDSPGGTAEGHRSGGWVADPPFVPEAFALKAEELEDTTALMFGRASCEVFAPYWRDSQDHVAYKDLPKYVVSSSLSEDALVAGWGPTTILRSTQGVGTLKARDGEGIFIHGSADLARRVCVYRLIEAIQPPGVSRAPWRREEHLRRGRPRQAEPGTPRLGGVLQRREQGRLGRGALIHRNPTGPTRRPDIVIGPRTLAHTSKRLDE